MKKGRRLVSMVMIFVLVMSVMQTTAYAASRKIRVHSPTTSTEQGDVRLSVSVNDSRCSYMKMYLRNNDTDEYIIRKYKKVYDDAYDKTMNLEPGEYKWRIKWYDSNGKYKESYNYYFKVVKGSSMNYIRPKVAISGLKDDSTVNEGSVSFSFQPTGSWKKLRFYIYDKSDSKYVQSKTYTTNLNHTYNLEPGRYKLKVYVYDSSGRYTDKEYIYFNVVKNEGGSTQVEYYPKYKGYSSSIVDALRSLGIDASFNNRSQIAKINGENHYSGSASQNTRLLNLLKLGQLIKSGFSGKSESTSTLTPSVTNYQNAIASVNLQTNSRLMNC